MRIENLLGLRAPTNASPDEKRKAKVAQMAIAILKKSAPEIADFQAGATFSDGQQEETNTAINDLKADHDRRDVHNAIAYVIDHGREAGIWQHPSWVLRAVVQLAPSPVTRADIDLIRGAAHRRERLLEALPQILRSDDECLLAGALIVAAADLSGIIQSNFLEQLLEKSILFHVSSESIWKDFRLGSEKDPWRNVRRWFLDPVSELLASKLVEKRGGIGQPRLKEKRAMTAIANVLQVPTNELTIAALVKSARARWSTQLPAALLDYAIRPVLSMSLPHTAWTRITTGKPLSKIMAPLPVRKLARCSNDVLDETESIDLPRNKVEVDQKESDLIQQREALQALMSALRRPKQDTKLNKRSLEERLDAWSSKHEHVGGWVPLFGMWVRSSLFERANGPFGRGPGPRVAGILRYAVGFSLRFLERFWGVAIDADHSVWVSHMELLRTDLATLDSASVSKTGLINFLRFAEKHGAPKIELGEDWRILVSPSEADSNVLTPAEFIRLKQWLKNFYHGVENSYPCLRAQVMLVLSFRLGTRWEELRNLRLKDCVISMGPERHGSIWIRKNKYADGKSSEFRRTLSVEHFLSIEEREQLAAFYAMAMGLGNGMRPRNDLLFADPGALSLPPREKETHDLIQSGMRIVSNDSSLVFHHLRHSAASYAHLRVSTDEVQDGNPFPWMIGWEEISSTKILGAPKNYAATLSGRSQYCAAQLYLVSELLGHLDPETSLRSYAHFMDVLMRRHVTSALHLSTALRAQLDGIKPASMRRRINRHSK